MFDYFPTEMIELAPGLHSVTVSAKPVEEDHGLARVKIKMVAINTFDGEPMEFGVERIIARHQFVSRFEQVANMLVEDISRIFREAQAKT